ncbi:hypothetical protein [Marinicrinis sediminis]|uniref:ABC transporter permease n=1 Tax=Marinicrinis sediminis TaxID=1652465 RepID=A0ABW5RAY5_9BACL
MKEAIRSIWKQNKFILLINFIIALIFFSIIMVVVVHFSHAQIEIEATNHFKGQNFYTISDELINEKEAAFFSKLSNYDRLYEFVAQLSGSSEFTYYSAVWQPIGLYDPKGNERFATYYESGQPSPVTERNGLRFQSVKSMQVNHHVIAFNHLQLANGRFFDEHEYVLTNEQIPVVLGSEYAGYYQIGDQVKIDYYNERFVGTIVGFLQPNQKITTANHPEMLLDRYIILPALSLMDAPSRLEVAQKEEMPVLIRALLLSQANGNLITDLNPLEIRDVLKEISSESGFESFILLGGQSLQLQTWIEMVEMNRMILLTLSVLLLMVLICMMSGTSMLKARKQIDTYKVFLISGASFTQIYRLAIYEWLIIYCMAWMFPFIYLIVLTSFTQVILLIYMIASLIIMLFMLVLLQLIMNRYMKKLDIVQKLKG